LAIRKSIHEAHTRREIQSTGRDARQHIHQTSATYVQTVKNTLNKR
jgi:hypothetical protein